MVKALAEHFIEQEFGVKSDTTVYSEHLYELAGLAEFFGPILVGRIKAGEEVPPVEYCNNHAGKSILNVGPQCRIDHQLRRFRAAGRTLGMPLCGNCTVGQTSASGGSIASQLP
jgi:hypothetical protein